MNKVLSQTLKNIKISLKYRIHMSKSNVFLLVIDSFRSDKFFGEKKTSKTPAIDSLIKKGVFFSQAISPAGSTSSSTATLFSGLHPFKTGMSGTKYKMINSKIPLYTNYFEEKNFNAYCYIPNTAAITLARAYGFSEKNVFTFSHTKRLFEGLGEKIIDTIQGLSEPWFLYVHLMDLHFPVWPPKEFDDSQYGESNYEKTVSGIDHWIGKFLEILNLDETLLIITADHGDYIPMLQKNNSTLNLEYTSTQKFFWKIGTKLPSFLYPLGIKLYFDLQKKRKKNLGEKISDKKLSIYEQRSLLMSRSDKHHRVFDDLIRVPLLFAGKNVPKTGQIKQQVGIVDVFPTALDILNISDKNSSDGRSLKPLFSNQELEEKPIYIESPPAIASSNQHVIGIRTSEFKYFRSSKSSKENIHLFDLLHDPLEEENISSKNPEIVEKMENLLQNLLSDKTNDSKDEELNDDEQKRVENELKKLGYM
jgi:arylsulfatase A-like enzyme